MLGRAWTAQFVLPSIRLFQGSCRSSGCMRKTIPETERWWTEASSDVYPLGAARLLFFGGCMVASGALAHFDLALIRLAYSPAALALVIPLFGTAWFPVAVLRHWNPEKRWSAIVQGGLRAIILLAACTVPAAAIFSWILAGFTDRIALCLIEGRGTAVEIGLMVLLALIYYHRTLPALLIGLDELGLLEREHPQQVTSVRSAGLEL